MRILVLLALFVSVSIVDAQTSAITHANKGGRFGDRLLQYAKAKWISQRCGIPLLYKPFQYSDQLMMHEIELLYDEERSKYGREVWVNSQKQVQRRSQEGIVMFCGVFCKLNGWQESEGFIPKDKKFVQSLKEVIKLRVSLPPPELPDGAITIADKDWPLKFPTDRYYIEQLRKLPIIFGNAQLYVYLFTDHPDPAVLVNKYAAAVDNPNIDFAYRELDNAHNANVLEDFFAMTYFDCLIRPESCFSMAAQLIADFKVIIYPKHHVWKDGVLIIDQVGIVNNAG